jgi:hypothetical protein
MSEARSDDFMLSILVALERIPTRPYTPSQIYAWEGLGPNVELMC